MGSEMCIRDRQQEWKKRRDHSRRKRCNPVFVLSAARRTVAHGAFDRANGSLQKQRGYRLVTIVLRETTEQETEMKQPRRHFRRPHFCFQSAAQCWCRVPTAFPATPVSRTAVSGPAGAVNRRFRTMIRRDLWLLSRRRCHCTNLSLIHI